MASAASSRRESHPAPIQHNRVSRAAANSALTATFAIASTAPSPITTVCRLNCASLSFHGLSGAASYSWSKTLDNSSEIFSTGSGGNTVASAQNPFDISAGEKSLSGLDFPQVASLYVIYELPFYKSQHGLIGKLLGGYQANATWRYSSGQTWTPALIPVPGFANDACQTSWDGTFIGLSSCRPFLGSAGAPVDTVGQCTDAAAPDCGLVNYYTGAATTKSSVHWIYNDNTAAQFFGTPYGNVRRNPGVRGQAIDAVNFSMFKNTMLTERIGFRVEAQVYNLFNHQFRGVPDPVIDDGNLVGWWQLRQQFLQPQRWGLHERYP